MSSSREKLNLKEPWLVVVDPQDEGIAKGWFESYPDEKAQPKCSPFIGHADKSAAAAPYWYCHRFDLDKSFSEKYLELQIDALRGNVHLWLNGAALSTVAGDGGPLHFSLDNALCKEHNELVMRVAPPEQHDERLLAIQSLYPTIGKGGAAVRWGLMGAVYLLAQPRFCITTLQVQPDLRRRRVVVNVALSEEMEDAEILLKIEGTDYAASGRPGKISIPLNHFDRWSPKQPHLYTLSVTLLLEQQVLDQRQTRFGMFEFGVKDHRFHLNHRPFLLRALHYRPPCPTRFSPADQVSLVRHDMNRAKAAGFNMLHLTDLPLPPCIFDLADELGMLLYVEYSCQVHGPWDGSTEPYTQGLRNLIQSRCQHPAVAIWGVRTEAGTSEALTDEALRNAAETLCTEARLLDPSRLIFGHHGGEVRWGSSYLIRPYHSDIMPYDALCLYQRAPSDILIRDYFANHGIPSRLAFVSAFGFATPTDWPVILEGTDDDADHSESASPDWQHWKACLEGFKTRGLDRLFGDFFGFCDAARQLQTEAAAIQIDAILSNPKLAGYCYLGMTEGASSSPDDGAEKEETPDTAVKHFAKVQASLRPIINLSKMNLGLREQCDVQIRLCNENGFSGTVWLTLQVIGPTNQTLWKKKRTLKVPRNYHELWSGTVTASSTPGQHRFVARFMAEDMTLLAEHTESFYVFEKCAASDVNIHLLDPENEYGAVLRSFAKTANLLAPVHIIPPLANTIRAYPDNELAQIMAQVKDGAIAIFFRPPEDWNDLAPWFAEGLNATAKEVIGGDTSVYHYAKLHPVFDKLPSRCLMGQPYAAIVPDKSFLEAGDEDICGAFYAPPITDDTDAQQGEDWWRTNILVHTYGAGRIVMTHLRILEGLGKDPAAGHLFVNLLNHFGRRSVPSNVPLQPEPKAVEWMHGQHHRVVRRWMVIGEFPNWVLNGGLNTVYPPEEGIDFNAAYEGWYQPVRWRSWYTRTDQDNLLDFQQALTPVHASYPKYDHALAYAYTEINADRRVEAVLHLGLQNDTRIWLNQTLIYEYKKQAQSDPIVRHAMTITLKPGKNTILVKGAKHYGAFAFSLDCVAEGAALRTIKWWK